MHGAFARAEEEQAQYRKRAKNTVLFYVVAESIWQIKDIVITKLWTNTIMPKLIYVYEGITNENGRNELINKKYFGGVHEGGRAVERLWQEVSEYIEASYDTEELAKIYINGDGGMD